MNEKAQNAAFELLDNNKLEYEIIFSLGGNIKLRLGTWKHLYKGTQDGQADQAGRDFHAYLTGNNPADWDGNEPDLPMKWDEAANMFGQIRLYKNNPSDPLFSVQYLVSDFFSGKADWENELSFTQSFLECLGWDGNEE